MAAKQPIDKLSGGATWLIEGFTYESSNGGARGLPINPNSKIQEVLYLGINNINLDV